MTDAKRTIILIISACILLLSCAAVGKVTPDDSPAPLRLVREFPFSFDPENILQFDFNLDTYLISWASEKDGSAAVLGNKKINLKGGAVYQSRLADKGKKYIMQVGTEDGWQIMTAGKTYRYNEVGFAIAISSDGSRYLYTSKDDDRGNIHLNGRVENDSVSPYVDTLGFADDPNAFYYLDDDFETSTFHYNGTAFGPYDMFRSPPGNKLAIHRQEIYFNKSLVYFGTRNGMVYIFKDGSEYGPFPGIMAAVNNDASKWSILVHEDGIASFVNEKSEKFAAFKNAFFFDYSGDSDYPMIIHDEDDGRYLFFNKQDYGPFDDISFYSCNPDFTRYAVAKEGNRAYVFMEDRRYGPFSPGEFLLVSNNSKSKAYLLNFQILPGVDFYEYNFAYSADADYEIRLLDGSKIYIPGKNIRDNAPEGFKAFMAVPVFLTADEIGASVWYKNETGKTANFFFSKTQVWKNDLEFDYRQEKSAYVSVNGALHPNSISVQFEGNFLYNGNGFWETYYIPGENGFPESAYFVIGGEAVGPYKTFRFREINGSVYLAVIDGQKVKVYETF